MMVGSTGIEHVVVLALELGKTVRNVKIYKRECNKLSERASDLTCALKEKFTGMEGTEIMSGMDELTFLLERAGYKATQWAEMGYMKSFVKQMQIKAGIMEVNDEIDLICRKFNIYSQADLLRGQWELKQIQERDTAENQETLRRILGEIGLLRDLITSTDPASIQDFMGMIQTMLRDTSSDTEQHRIFSQGLYDICRMKQILPPIADLSGQVVKTSKYPVAIGRFNDVYTGLWLDQEKVALKLPRSLNYNEVAQKRFQREVNIWRHLQHPNIVRLYGTVTFNNQILSVSAWMEMGNVMTYTSILGPAKDRFGILIDVASGLEYLHQNHIMHGNLRGANVLIDANGRALISDMGLSMTINELIPDDASGDTSIRWKARELVLLSEYQNISTPSSDVWSFGMLCLEVMTDEQPYRDLATNAMVILELASRRLPPQPTEAPVVARGLDNVFWGVLSTLWCWDPVQRPNLTAVKLTLKNLAKPRSSKIVPQIKDVIGQHSRTSRVLLAENGQRVVPAQEQAITTALLRPGPRGPPPANGLYYLINVATELRLDVDLGREEEGTFVIGWTPARHPSNQMWTWKCSRQEGDGFLGFLQVKHSDGFMIPTSQKAGSSIVQSYRPTFWQVVPQGNGNFKVRWPSDSGASPGLVLRCDAALNFIYLSVENAGDTHQCWKFSPVTKENT